MNISSAIDNVGVKAAVSAGNYAYLQIPTNSLRGFFDALFPSLAKNATADIARGFGHRWTAGHDLLIDIPKTVSKYGATEGAKQTGHILLTDFPTKAGIPIPGLSSSGLGNFLTETCKIPSGYLCLNVMDTAVGIFAMTEGAFDLFNVISQNLRMSPKLFLDTFVEGAAEIAAGVHCENPLLLIAGAEEIAAGIHSSLYTITHPVWYVNPLDFFSGCLSAGILTLLISKFLLKKDNTASLVDAAKSCFIGGLLSISVHFWLGGMIALCGCGLGKLMAERDNKSQLRHFRISRNELIRLQTFSRSLVPDVATAKWWFLNLPSDELRLPDYSDVKFSDLLLPSDGGECKLRLPDYSDVKFSDLLLPSDDKATFVKLLGASPLSD